MTESLPYRMEDPKKPYKLVPKDHHGQQYYYPKKAKGMSFFAFILSIFVYISIFYIFNLSPSTLFKNSKFWFLISNTLILIIAVDYGSFSSSKNRPRDLYDEYLAHSSDTRRVATNAIISFPPSDYEEERILKQTHVVHEPKRHDSEEKPYMQKRQEDETTPEKPLSQDVVVDHSGQRDEDVQEKKIVHVDIDKIVDFDADVDVDVDVLPQPNRRRYRRSKSDMPKTVMVRGESKKNGISRSKTTKIREIIDDRDEEVNEFSTMSDEDLNRRVEEFIQRFNRQIRLQAREDRLKERNGQF